MLEIRYHAVNLGYMDRRTKNNADAFLCTKLHQSVESPSRHAGLRRGCDSWAGNTAYRRGSSGERIVSSEPSKPDTRDIVAELAQEADEKRRTLLAEIQNKTNRNVLNYSATAVGASGEIMMTPDIVNLTRIMVKDRGLRGVDLILNSPGGQPEVAEKIITTLRHYYDDDFRVIVPEIAKSAGTIVCLGADAILMGYCSELGPIDPQMQVRDAQGNIVFRSAHAIIESVDSYVRLAHEAIAADKPFQAYVRLLDSHPDLAFVEECRLAQKLSQEIARKWLKAKMLKDNPEKAVASAEALSRADLLFSHGRAIDHRYAKEELGLSVQYLPPGDELWKNVWELHIRCFLSHYQGRQVKIIEGPQRTLAFSS